MISYFRTTKTGAGMAINLFGEIPTMVLKSIRSTYVFHAYTDAERIIYDLDRDEWFTQTKITDTTHIVVIPSMFLQDAEIKAMVGNISIPWVHIKQRGMSKKDWYYTDCYAYITNDDNLFFKLPGLKKQLKFSKSSLVNND